MGIILILFHLVFCSPNLSIFPVGYFSLASKVRQFILMFFPYHFNLLISPMAEMKAFFNFFFFLIFFVVVFAIQ